LWQGLPGTTSEWDQVTDPEIQDGLKPSVEAFLVLDLDLDLDFQFSGGEESFLGNRGSLGFMEDIWSWIWMI
jgi:hypothetical protein